MPTVLLIVFGLITLGLFGWIVRRVSRSRTFATSDAIALLGLVISLLIAVLPLAMQQQAAQPAAPTVSIEGPDAARVGQRAYFTIVSSGAVKAEWSAGGFANGEIFTIDPLPPSASIYVEPTDPSRAGESFTLAATVTASDGKTATATKKFVLLGP